LLGDMLKIENNFIIHCAFLQLDKRFSILQFEYYFTFQIPGPLKSVSGAGNSS
jgi:hypothetical protein